MPLNQPNGWCGRSYMQERRLSGEAFMGHLCHNEEFGFFKKKFYTVFKGYFSFTVITKY